MLVNIPLANLTEFSSFTYTVRENTGINQKRWNDEVKKENSTFAPANPENEEIVTYYDNVNPTRRQATRSKFEIMKVKNADGGYIYTEVPQNK